MQKKKEKKERKGKDVRMLIRSNLTYLPLDLLWSQMDKRRNGNQEGFVDTSYHPLHKFTMPRVVVKFTQQFLGELGGLIVFSSCPGRMWNKCRLRCITWWIPL
jgi:hypothetical protein